MACACMKREADRSFVKLVTWHFAHIDTDVVATCCIHRVMCTRIVLSMETLMNSQAIESVQYIQLEPTTRCNFTCNFCCGRKMAQGDLEWDTFIRTLDTFPNLKHIQLQGEGEPLLHARFFDMAREIKSRGIKLSTITNGTKLNSDSVVEQILDIGFERISISMESANPTKFKEIRGGNLSKVVSGIKNLVAAKKRRQSDRPIIDLAVTILESTAESIFELVPLYRELEIDGGISTQFLQKMEAYVESYDKETMQEVVQIGTQRKVEQAISQINELIGTGPEGGYYDDLFDGYKPENLSCPWLKSGAFVSFTGNITPCCKVKDYGRFGCGNVLSEPKELFMQKNQELSDSLKNGIIPSACKSCPHSEAITKISARKHQTSHTSSQVVQI